MHPSQEILPSQKGGTIYEDVRTLAVPFVLLLAKSGLDKWRKKNETNKTRSGKQSARVQKMKGGNSQRGGFSDVAKGLLDDLAKLRVSP